MVVQPIAIDVEKMNLVAQPKRTHMVINQAASPMGPLLPHFFFLDSFWRGGFPRNFVEGIIFEPPSTHLFIKGLLKKLDNPIIFNLHLFGLLKGTIIYFNNLSNFFLLCLSPFFKEETWEFCHALRHNLMKQIHIVLIFKIYSCSTTWITTTMHL